MNLSETTQFIRSLASSAGFDHCGIAAAVPLDEDARKLEAWLHQGMHGSMHYMEKHFDLRVNPYKLLPGARSVISLLINYYPAARQPEGSPKVSKYAYSKDYHEVIRPKLNAIILQMKEKIGDFQGRGFVDSAPVLERSWAVRSGLGWVGKNGNLIHKKQGSYFFIATLIVDFELEYDAPHTQDFCGTCTRCIDACPTQAIHDNKVVDGSQCISYFTIELKELLIPEKMKGKFDNWMFGCDTCQDVCPWNHFSKPATEPAFSAIPEILQFNTKDWEGITEEGFKKIFSDSPLKRAKYQGIRRNLVFLKPG
ncbi:MAG: tRNA epoxyqueuosine(34) reductase QueG [Bacteroidota bacterium]|nr:tRNA epoxyqueuosine(34) reductase QueG [Bacteroidota bacterium]MDP4249540.1 tRNA epoxyqueuosine(34) reductase QueG [Bacteroidota bacterium]